MNYSELVHFDNAKFAHIVAREEYQRLRRIDRNVEKAASGFRSLLIERREGSRSITVV